MTSIWLSFLLRDVAQSIMRDPGKDLRGYRRRFDAVALFADVSGFTPISEALARSGRRGAEELTTILNSYFEPMIALIESFGGIVGKFGGDAMTVLFPYTTRTQAAAVRRALRCALEMQAGMGRYEAIPTSAGTFGIAMKAGLAMGSVLTAVVGDPDIWLEYVVAGEPLDRCAEAEHHATKGEVVLHNSLLPYAGQVDVVEARGEYSCIGGLGGPVRRTPLAPLAQPDSAAIDVFARFLHPAIAERLRAGQRGFINEHRKVTTMFVSFAGFDYDSDPLVAARLQRYFLMVSAIVQRYDGHVARVDMGDKGSKYIVLFGAPVIHEDDEERAIRCALELRDIEGVTVRIGVNTGVVYCGGVGSETRQEYTVMGDPVNLAARLMQAARPGTVLVNETTRRPVADRFTWEDLAPITVKGKSKPIAISTAVSFGALQPQGLHLPAYALPMVGRAHELELARARIAQAAGGHGQLLGICAEAGMGKSRLGTAIAEMARQSGFRVLGGSCQSYGTHTSYLVWHDVWRSFFGIGPDWEPEEAIHHLHRQLNAINPRMAARMPLLGVALNLPIPDSMLTAGFNPQLRTDLLKSLLLECLRALVKRPLPAARSAESAEGNPQRVGSNPEDPDDGRRATDDGRHVIVLEDCHWIDPLSQELLEFIGRNIADLPIVLLVLYRPPIDEGGPMGWAARTPFFHEIGLAELGTGEAAQLARQKVAQHWGAADAAPAELIRQVVARANGNPFYLEEIINYLRDRGVNPRDVASVDQLDLPDSLHSLILSRIDQLAEAEKTTLKVGSVIGRLFKAHWLWGSYPPLGAPPEVLRHLQNLSRLDLTPLDKSEPELEYMFKHIMTQEVAYESLAFATRTELHERLGGFIERNYAGALGQFVDVLAHHFGRSTNMAKQRQYFRMAGDAAGAAYANQAALAYYRRLYPLLSEVERAPLLVDMGEIQQLAGAWTEAEQSYSDALMLAKAHGDERAQARSLVALGSLLASTHSFAEARQWLAQGQAAFERLGDLRGVGRALEHAGMIAFEQADYEMARASAEQRLQIAHEQHDQGGISAALDQIGIVCFITGEFDQALAFLRESLAIAHRAGDHRRAILAGNDLAGVYWQRGDYSQALECLGQALTAAVEIGYLQSIGFILGNAGSVYKERGDLDRALACYRDALQITADLGDWPAILLNIGNLALALRADNDDTGAEQLWQRSIALGRALDILFGLCEDLYHLAELYARQLRHAEAQPLCREALAIARQVERRDIQLQAEVLLVRLRAALGELVLQEALQELDALAEQWGEPEERALLLYARWQVRPGDEEAQHGAADAYRALHAEAPNAEYRQRYTELVGEVLPEPPPLPDLPEVGLQAPVGLAVLIERISRMSEALISPAGG